MFQNQVSKSVGQPKTKQTSESSIPNIAPLNELTTPAVGSTLSSAQNPSATQDNASMKADQSERLSWVAGLKDHLIQKPTSDFVLSLGGLCGVVGFLQSGGSIFNGFGSAAVGSIAALSLSIGMYTYDYVRDR